MYTELKDANEARRSEVQDSLMSAGFTTPFPLYRLGETADLIEALVKDGRARGNSFQSITLKEATQIVGESNFNFWEVLEGGSHLISSHTSQNAYWRLDELAGQTPDKIVDLDVL